MVVWEGVKLDNGSSPRNGVGGGAVFRALERASDRGELALGTSTGRKVRIRCRRGWLSEVDDEGTVLVCPAIMADFVALPGASHSHSWSMVYCRAEARAKAEAGNRTYSCGLR